MMPALLTRMVGGPSSAATWATAAAAFLVGDVDGDADRLAASGVDLVGDYLAGGFVQVEDGDGVAVRTEAGGYLGTDTTGGSGDDSDTLGHGNSLCGCVFRAGVENVVLVAQPWRRRDRC